MEIPPGISLVFTSAEFFGLKFASNWVEMTEWFGIWKHTFSLFPLPYLHDNLFITHYIAQRGYGK